jgi:D-amino peptidase
MRRMLVAVSVDMEGASQLRNVREIYGCMPEYWETGKPRLEADVAAACEGLLAGGASDLVVLDNHGGNTLNVSPESLPRGARLETWHVYDLTDHGVDAMFQVGYHARGGVEGFLSHTYVPGLRLRVGSELISESHARAWAAEVPLLGIVGNDRHHETLGSLEGTPYLVVQQSIGRDAMRPVFDAPQDGLDAIYSFAEDCARRSASASAPAGPAGVTFEASTPNGRDVADDLAGAGWTRVGDVEFAVELETWRDSREPLAAAMNAALAPFLPYWLGGFASAEDAAAADRERVQDLVTIFDAWAAESQPQWYTEAADPFPAGIAERLDASRTH